jgi:hypothetical protein
MTNCSKGVNFMVLEGRSVTSPMFRAAILTSFQGLSFPFLNCEIDIKLRWCKRPPFDSLAVNEEMRDASNVFKDFNFHD